MPLEISEIGIRVSVDQAGNFQTIHGSETNLENDSPLILSPLQTQQIVQVCVHNILRILNRRAAR